MEYRSSEELQRHKAEVFASEQAKKAVDVSERDRIFKVIDSHIAKHSSTVSVRELARANNKTADYQLDLSADIVALLNKIKSELK